MIPSDIMEVDSQQWGFEEVLADDRDKWMIAIKNVKNMVIGNNKYKQHAIEIGIINRMLQWMIDERLPVELRLEAAVVLGSLAKGEESCIVALVRANAISVLLNGLFSPNLKYVEACLRCLRTIYSHSLAPVEKVYESSTIVPHLINIMSKSPCTQECITTILASCCQSPEHQNLLYLHGAIPALAPLLCSTVYKVQMPTLKCFAKLCYENPEVSEAIASTTHNGEPIPRLLAKLQARDLTSEMQMAAARVMTYLCRADAICTDDPDIQLRTLQTLVRMCKRDRPVEENVEGAETLAYLVEVDPELQAKAAITDHLIRALAEYLKYNNVTMVGAQQKKDVDKESELKQAAFKAFASLGANDESIRKKVIVQTEKLMEHIVTGLKSDNLKVQAAATRCLHSLSRSVQQLRTTFQDHTVWKPLMKIIQNGSGETFKLATSTMCNLLLEFSPSKELILEYGAIDILASMVSKEDTEVRLNGVWGLMNMAFKAERNVKMKILQTLGSDRLFELLSDTHADIVLKTLGLLRNLLSEKEHIDSVLKDYSNQVMHAVVYILEGDHDVKVKEQTLCILGNVADGEEGKERIMENDDILKKLMSYMASKNTELQIAAIFCITNLLWRSNEGGSAATQAAYSRQHRLRDMGVQKLLQQLADSHPEEALYDQVRTALQQFQ